MKATELMIGDLVCLKDDIKCELPLKIDGVLTNDISLEGEGFLGGAEGLIRPIPITPEILEKNGFERGVITPSKFYRNIDNERLMFCSYGSCYGLGYVHWNESNDADIMHRLEVQQPIMYIHQMQHALRLFGLDQLADNFKI